VKKRLNKDLVLYSVKFFPKYLKKKSKKKHQIVVGVGGNIKNSIKRFQKLFIYLKRSKNFTLIESSYILKNPPFGYLDQPYFFNTVLLLKTNLTPHLSLRALQKIEKKFKRKRIFKNSPRTLDLDIIFFDKITYNKKNLTIPHRDFLRRESVLIPLHLLRSEL